MEQGRLHPFRIEGLSEIWCFNDEDLEKKDEGLKDKHPMMFPKVALSLVILMGIFLLIYAGILLLVVIRWENLLQ